MTDTPTPALSVLTPVPPAGGSYVFDETLGRPVPVAPPAAAPEHLPQPAPDTTRAPAAEAATTKGRAK
jgi:hypothetical protein